MKLHALSHSRRSKTKEAIAFPALLRSPCTWCTALASSQLIGRFILHLKSYRPPGPFSLFSLIYPSPFSFCAMHTETAESVCGTMPVRTCGCVSARVCVCARVCACMCACVSAHVGVCVCVCACMLTCMSVCMHECVFLCVISSVPGASCEVLAYRGRPYPTRVPYPTVVITMSLSKDAASRAEELGSEPHTRT